MRYVVFTLLLVLATSAHAETSRGIDTLAQKFAALGDKPEASAIDELSDDPTTLRAVALKVHLTDPKLAAIIYDHALSKDEINRYERFAGSAYARAARAEAFGELDRARKLWREAAAVDPLTTYIHASRYSVDPERDKLFNEIRDQVKSLHSTALAGGEATIYTTAKGTRRNLVPMTQEEALATLESGQSLRYAAIQTLDLTGKTFASTVSCSRCVIGELKGWEASFSGFSYRGFVLNDFHIGKSWTGEVNRSRSLPAATFEELLLDKAVVFGNLQMDSVSVSKAAGFPFVVVDGDADLRNTAFSALDMRFAQVRGTLTLEGATLSGAAYFGHLHAGGLQLTRARATTAALLFDSATFTGPVTAARCQFAQGVTFENSTFGGPVDVHHCEIADRLNLSRARFLEDAAFQYVELDDLDALGAAATMAFSITDSVIRGNARFALDGFTRRQHLGNPDPLHTLYKQYQGDLDADELLTNRSQYGVVHVDDLSMEFASDASFANTYFEKFVGFEGVEFGSEGEHSVANFYNAQLSGEAHFERTKFWSIADFRTISGNELSFNRSYIDKTWMLDDANVPGRLSLTQIEFGEDATLSFRGARLAFFGITMGEIMSNGRSRLFYEQCLDRGEHVEGDDRLLDAVWDEDNEVFRNSADVGQIAQRLCLDFAIAEFVVLRDSFTKRGMTQEADWAYWKLRHTTNLKDRRYADGPIESARAWLQWVFFEKAFGWGVHLQNLFWSSLFVILFYMLLFRLLCPNVMLDWDDAAMPLRDLPKYALFVISLHSFLGRARDWKSKSSNKVWKVLYTTEMIIGILLITFFIGAYARIILR